MAIRGVFFDAADVLYRRAVSSGHLVSHLLQGMGLCPDAGAAAQVRQRALRAQANTGRMGPAEYWNEVFLLYGVAGPEDRKRCVAQMMAHADRVLPMDGVRDVLAILKQRGFLLGIITDTIHPLAAKQRWLDSVGISEFIDVLACSNALGVHKPDPAMYLSALQEAHLAPPEAAFVGHDADELGGARRVGEAQASQIYVQLALFNLKIVR